MSHDCAHAAPLGSFANAFEEAFAASEEWRPGQED